MTVEKQIYFDAYHNVEEVKALEKVVVNNGVPANALHIYADDSLIQDKNWMVRLSGVKEAENLIGYKRIDQDKPIIVGIDECHEDKIPVIKYAMDQLSDEEKGISNDFNPLTDSHPIIQLDNGDIVSDYADLSDEEVRKLLNEHVEDHGDFREHQEAKDQSREHDETELEKGDLSSFEEEMRQGSSTIPPEDYGVHQDNYEGDAK